MLLTYHCHPTTLLSMPLLTLHGQKPDPLVNMHVRSVFPPLILNESFNPVIGTPWH